MWRGSNQVNKLTLVPKLTTQVLVIRSRVIPDSLLEPMMTVVAATKATNRKANIILNELNYMQKKAKKKKKTRKKKRIMYLVISV